MEEPGFNLIQIAESGRRHRRLLILLTIICSVGGAICHFAGTKYYEAKAEFVLRNPQYNDRNFVYNYDGKLIDYFASEDDNNRVVAMATSSSVMWPVIRKTGLAQALGIDTSMTAGAEKLLRIVEKRLNVTRTENRDITLTYTDTDPVRAATVANEVISTIETEYRKYFTEMRQSMSQTVFNKVDYEDSAIRVLTDSLVSLRAKYGINEILSPARHNLILSNAPKGSNAKEYAKGLEEVQNVESIKDEMVADRAVSVTLAHQYSLAMKQEQLPLVKVITPATPPARRKGLGAVTTILICAMAGFLFGLLACLMKDNYTLPRRNDNN